jgi:hypothetical protein
MAESQKIVSGRVVAIVKKSSLLLYIECNTVFLVVLQNNPSSDKVVFALIPVYHSVPTINQTFVV